MARTALGCSAASHEALKSSPDDIWASLPAPPKGNEMHMPDLGVHLSLRNCTGCDSTLARPLPGHVLDDQVSL